MLSASFARRPITVAGPVAIAAALAAVSLTVVAVAGPASVAVSAAPSLAPILQRTSIIAARAIPTANLPAVLFFLFAAFPLDTLLRELGILR